MKSIPTEQLTQRVARTLLPFATSTPSAIATAFGISNEATARAALALPTNLGAALIGRRTPALDRRRRELDDAAQFHGRTRIHSETARPLVNWHESGRGPALLLLNGFTASGLVWPERWLHRLEDRYRVIRVDNRGTGWSRSAPAPFTIANMADDARDVLKACEVDRAVVLGLSMGGMIAQELAIRHADIVDKLVLVATRPPTPAQIAPGLDASLHLLKQPPSTVQLHDFLTDTWARMAGERFASDHTDAIAEIVEQIIRRVTPRSGVMSQVRAMYAWHGAHRLHRITVDTTVVHGDRDPLVPVGNGMRLARLIPGTTYLELSGVGHLVAHENGDALLQLLDV
jgi:pimeloyl-ACP methyl ester carboxylesterase